jgi:hypothetical protein
VVVKAEMQVVGLEAGVDERVLHRLRVEHRELPVALFQRKELGRGMLGALLAEGRVVEPAHRGGQPHSALAVDHHVVIIDARVPDLPVAPIGRRHCLLQRIGKWQSRDPCEHPD